MKRYSKFISIKVVLIQPHSAARMTQNERQEVPNPGEEVEQEETKLSPGGVSSLDTPGIKQLIFSVWAFDTPRPGTSSPACGCHNHAHMITISKRCNWGADGDPAASSRVQLKLAKSHSCMPEGPDHEAQQCVTSPYWRMKEASTKFYSWEGITWYFAQCWITQVTEGLVDQAVECRHERNLFRVGTTAYHPNTMPKPPDTYFSVCTLWCLGMHDGVCIDVRQKMQYNKEDWQGQGQKMANQGHLLLADWHITVLQKKLNFFLFLLF